MYEWLDFHYDPIRTFIIMRFNKELKKLFKINKRISLNKCNKKIPIGDFVSAKKSFALIRLWAKIFNLNV
jgi:hypothetical protein